MVYRLLLLLAGAAAVKRSAYYYPLATPYVFADSPYVYQEANPFPFISYNVPAPSPVPPLTATVDIKNYGGDTVTGRLMLTQLPGGPVLLMGNVTGLTPGPHGMHIHEFGDLTNGCESMGAHFNPTLSQHGGPADPYRHVGDLGNIVAGQDGIAKISESDHIISLTGPYSILGRGLIIHSGRDDYGRGGDKESLRTGNSGTRVACGVVSWALPPTAMANPNVMPQGMAGTPPQANEPDAEPVEP